MFCSSLRKRRDWACVVPALSRAAPSGWKETKLETHDIAFPTPSRGGQNRTFKLVLLSFTEVGTPQAKERIERLSMLDGGRNVAVVLLLPGNGDMTSFMSLQMGMLNNMAHVPIIPISSAMELRSCLDLLQRQYGNNGPSCSKAEELALTKDLASHCVHGQALPHQQTNILTDISAGLGDLTRRVFDPEGQRQVRDLLGDADGKRVVSFFIDGPALVDA